MSGGFSTFSQQACILWAEHTAGARHLPQDLVFDLLFGWRKLLCVCPKCEPRLCEAFGQHLDCDQQSPESRHSELTMITVDKLQTRQRAQAQRDDPDLLPLKVFFHIFLRLVLHRTFVSPFRALDIRVQKLRLPSHAPPASVDARFHSGVISFVLEHIHL